MAGIASAATSVVLAHIAEGTTTIRVGAGGIMLPNHAPYVIAEQFGTLARLFPGRIDLGLGRAPGTDPVTSYALRRRQDAREGDDFLERFQELILMERGGFPPEHPFRSVRAVPADVALPPIWLLGSSGYSAELAAAVGMGFSFAYHFADYDAASAMLSYRNHFKPSATLKEPYAILGTAVIAADTDAEAERIALSADLHYVRRAKGEYLPLAVEGEKADHVVAFVRKSGSASVLIVVPRLVAGLLQDMDVVPIGPRIWGDTHVLLPSSPEKYWNAFTGESTSLKSNGGAHLSVSRVLKDFPVAVCSLG